jgi:TRAP-type transport system periplasmic protein
MLEPKGWNATRFTIALLAAAVAGATGAAAQNAVHYRFAYDQPRTTGYGVAADIFSDKLKELSRGTMLIDQFPASQLGQEPQVLQLLRSGDIDFAITSTANTATVSPQAGVMSLHFLFRSEDHVKRAIADPKVAQAVRDMIDDTVQGAHVVGLATLGLRSLYGKKEVHKIADLKGLKVRVQATATEDTMFPAYGAQTVHMPFGSVYTSLQTGLVDFAENGVNIYQANKHYEVAPVLSISEHEANNVQPGKAFDLEHQSATRLKAIGVKVVTDVDKTGFLQVAEPYLETLSKQLGPHATKIRQLIGAIN